ncbi:hypothetical protein GGR56DRAFT_161520 [Xylariaceae sp. FL0804]|nr:hypothetical protein GGR56DRAFT_161520 [Xylariaceae sp. FL0804]
MLFGQFCREREAYLQPIFSGRRRLWLATCLEGGTMRLLYPSAEIGKSEQTKECLLSPGHGRWFHSWIFLCLSQLDCPQWRCLRCCRPPHTSSISLTELRLLVAVLQRTSKRYFRDSSLAPDISIPTVMHQLHCLYIIRRAYGATIRSLATSRRSISAMTAPSTCPIASIIFSRD